MDFLKLTTLFREHAYQVAMKNGWHTEGECIPTYRAWLRAEQFLRLDILLAEHRAKYATLWEPMPSRKALHHYLFVHNELTPKQTNQLSLAEILLVLHADLAGVNIPEEVLESPCNGTRDPLAVLHEKFPLQTELPLCSDDEWDPLLAEKVLGLRKR